MFMMDSITGPNCCRIFAVEILAGLHAMLVLAVIAIPVPVLLDVLVAVLVVLVLGVLAVVLAVLVLGVLVVLVPR